MPYSLDCKLEVPPQKKKKISVRKEVNWSMKFEIYLSFMKFCRDRMKILIPFNIKFFLLGEPAHRPQDFWKFTDDSVIFIRWS
jgi:hypothetical protein